MTRTSRQARRRQGSVLILVIVVIVLIMILVASYVHVAKVDVDASRHMDTHGVEQVVVAEVAAMQRQLKEDLVNPDGRFLDPSYAAGDANNPDYGDEGYDYPWTNQDVEFDVETLYGGTKKAKGGRYDDRWLASTVPDFSVSGDVKWPHLTNTTGLFLRLPLEDLDTNTGTKLPKEIAVRNGGYEDRDTDVKIFGSQSLETQTNQYGPLGVDADGDGYADARWSWSVLPRVEEDMMVVARTVRDLSSLVNVNVATAMTTDGQNNYYDGGGGRDRIRGLYPSEIDLTRLLRRSGVGSWGSELGALLEERLGAGGQPLSSQYGLDNPPATPGVSDANTRAGHWFTSGRMWGSTAHELFINNELELRLHNGCNNPEVTPTLEQRMPNVMRASEDDEVRAYDISATPAAGGPTDVGHMERFFVGGSGAIKNRQFIDVRHLVTLNSGHVPYITNWRGRFLQDLQNSAAHFVTNTQRATKYDLTYQHYDLIQSNAQQAFENLYGAFSTIFRAGDTSYLGLDRGAAPADYDHVDVAAWEYALAVHDYMDTDRHPSWATKAVGGRNIKFFGLEPVPFVREVYVDMQYETVWGAGGAPPVQHQVDRWRVQQNTMRLVVELGNPFDRDIDFNDVYVWIQFADRNPVRIHSSNFSMIDKNGQATSVLPANGRLILYSESSRKHDDEGNSKGADLRDLGFTDDYGASGDLIIGEDKSKGRYNGVDQVAGANMGVRLYMSPTNNYGDGVIYDGFPLGDGVNNLDLNAVYMLPGGQVYIDDPAGSPIDDRHAQGAVARDGRKIRFITNMGKSLVGLREPGDPSKGSEGRFRYDGAGGSNNPVSQLNRDEKEQTNGTPIVAPHTDPPFGPRDTLDRLQLANAGRPMYSVTELGWVLMIGVHNDINGNLPARLSGVDGKGGLLSTAAGRKRLFLDFGDSTVGTTATTIDNGSGYLTRITHGALMTDVFTTLSPRYDNADNNGNGAVDDGGEEKVAGTININTVPVELLTLAAPVPEPIDEVQALAERIVQYRDNPGDRSQLTRFPANKVRPQPGIATMGELMHISPSTSGNIADYMQRYAWEFAFGMSPQSTHNKQFDVYPMPESGADARDVPDSAEEKMARFQMLANTFSVRSDYFVGYFVVRGYSGGDFRLGPNQSAWFLAIFDRSEVQSAGGEVKVLGVYRIH